MFHQPGVMPAVPHALATLLESEGLELAGIAPADTPADREKREYREWIASGRNGEMEYLRRHAPMKYRASLVLPGCRSVVVVGMSYFQSAHDVPAQSGRVAQYAWGRDYHNALGKRLRRIVRTLRKHHPAHSFRSLVDASPLSERFFAEKAGIGFTGKNTLLISSRYGSWFFLGTILTTMELKRTALPERSHRACPSGCFRCGSACPTGALEAPHRIDARRCISYLTIEHRGRINPELRPLMGNWVFGCDLCQESCPLNLHAQNTTHSDFTAHRAGEHLDLRQLLTIPDDTTYRRRFAGTPLLRPGRQGMVRNACIAAANTRDTNLLPELSRLKDDSDEVIADAAGWAVDQLEKV